ncbi:MAG: shikimate dehydrogenase [Pseudomonadota bacterium]
MTDQTEYFCLGVVGWPVAHSLSPIMHNYWLQKHHLKGTYSAFPVQPPDIETALTSADKLGLQGLNVTIPYKENAFSIASKHSKAAVDTGAVNTLSYRNDGIYGDNTDKDGFFQHLINSSGRSDWTGAAALVIGAGGAALAVVLALKEAGFARVFLANRNVDRAQSLIDRLGGAPIVFCPDNEKDSALKQADLIVNATSLGMSGQPALELNLDLAQDRACVYDIVYTPLHTPLLKAAAARGLTTIDGLGMLIGQARKSFEIWTGVEPDLTDELRTLLLDRLGRSA